MRISHYMSADLFAATSYDAQPQQSKFFLHTHPHAEIFHFLQGKAIFHVEGNAYPLKPGDILLIRPTEAHYIELDPSVPYRRTVINLDLSLLESLAPGTPLLQPFMEREAGHRNLYRQKDLGNEVYTYLNALADHSDDRLSTLADIILVLRRIHQIYNANQDVSAQPPTVEVRILRYINHHLGEDLTLEQLCNVFFISRAQLCRRFKKATGTSVGRYISIKRLIMAQQMLRQGKRPLDVFGLCGFLDYSSFYRAYTKYFGHTPSEAPGSANPPETLADYSHIIA